MKIRDDFDFILLHMILQMMAYFGPLEKSETGTSTSLEGRVTCGNWRFVSCSVEHEYHVQLNSGLLMYSWKELGTHQHLSGICMHDFSSNLVIASTSGGVEDEAKWDGCAYLEEIQRQQEKQCYIMKMICNILVI